MLRKNSIKWTVTAGAVRGYATDGKVKGEIIARDEAVAAWMKAANDVEAKTGLYISCSVAESATLYKEEWGCPEGGEPSFTFFGSSNPAFTTDMSAYADAVVKVAGELLELLGQSTLSVEMTESNYTYFC